MLSGSGRACGRVEMERSRGSVHSRGVVWAFALCMSAVMALACAQGALGARRPRPRPHPPHSTPPSAFSEFPVRTARSQPDRITAGPDGNVWFSEEVGNKIARITPNGKISEFQIPTAGRGSHGITAGPDGNIWFTETAGKIGRITPSGRISEFQPPAGPGGLFGITAGPDGNLWFTEAAANQIGRITPSGKISEFPLPLPTTTVKSLPYGIAAGRDGNLWFTEEAAARIGRITPSGQISKFRSPQRKAARSGSRRARTATCGSPRSTPPRSGGSPRAARSASFRSPEEEAARSGSRRARTATVVHRLDPNKIGRITRSGQITEFRVPSEESLPIWITAGPDRNLWFTEAFANQIARVRIGLLTEQPSAWCPA